MFRVAPMTLGLTAAGRRVSQRVDHVHLTQCVQHARNHTLREISSFSVFSVKGECVIAGETMKY